jgi:hypothetical protein
LTARDITDASAAQLLGGFWAHLRDRNGHTVAQVPQRPARLTFLEKTPKNALRIPFLNALFPTAKFIFLYRDPRSNIGSLIDGWNSRKFITYPLLPGWEGQPWSFLLVPGWRKVNGGPVSRVAALQWEQADQHIIDDLSGLSRSRWRVVRYESLIADPRAVIRHLCDFVGMHFDARLESVVSGQLPFSAKTLTAPNPDKWRRYEQSILPLLPVLEPLIWRLDTLEHVKVSGTRLAPIRGGS